MKVSRIAALPILFVLNACVDMNTEYAKMLDTWIGAPEIALIRTWGTPIRTYEMSNITYITFRDSSIFSTPGTSPSYSTTFVGNSAYTTSYGGISPSVVQLQCETTFGVRNGIVVDYTFQGNHCVAPLDEAPDYVPQSATSIVW